MQKFHFSMHLFKKIMKEKLGSSPINELSSNHLDTKIPCGPQTSLHAQGPRGEPNALPKSSEPHSGPAVRVANEFNGGTRRYPHVAQAWVFNLARHSFPHIFRYPLASCAAACRFLQECVLSSYNILKRKHMQGGVVGCAVSKQHAVSNRCQEPSKILGTL